MFEPNAVDPYLFINPASRHIEPNWMWRDVLPFWLGPNPALYPTAKITLTTGIPVAVPYKLPHSSIGLDQSVGTPLQINQIIQLPPPPGTFGNFTVMVADMGDQRQYMNYPIHVDTFAGSGQLSARLTEDLFLPTRHQLLVTFNQISGEASDNQLFFAGKYFDPWSTNLQNKPHARKDMHDLINRLLERRKYVTPYWLTTENGVVAVPANQTVEVDTLIGDEGHLECSHIMRNLIDGGITGGAFELELINPQTRQSLMNGKIHSQFIGDAHNPQPFPAPFLVPAGQILRFRITDLSGSTNNVYLTLRGERIRAPFKSRAEVEREFGMADKAVKQKSGAKEMAGMI